MSAAKSMIDRLKQTERGELIQDMERLCIAYIQLANFNVEQYKKETREFNVLKYYMGGQQMEWTANGTTFCFTGICHGQKSN